VLCDSAPSIQDLKGYAERPVANRCRKPGWPGFPSAQAVFGLAPAVAPAMTLTEVLGLTLAAAAGGAISAGAGAGMLI
jgi:hypothetical protein